MNITEPLLEYIEVEYHDEVWQQPMDYEYIPFHCRRCHEYGHLFKQCPLNASGAVAGKGEEEKEEAEANKEDGDGFTEVPTRRKSKKGSVPLKPFVKTLSQESPNKFGVLQGEEMEMEREDSEEEPVEPTKGDKGKDTMQTSLEQVKDGESTRTPHDQTQMEIDRREDKGSEEEQVMKRLLHEWRHLGERFILEEQKQLYKEMFQKYKEKGGVAIANHQEQLGAQEGQGTETGNAGKVGRKWGIRPMSETIQMVGDMLVNSGGVIPLSEVLQQPLNLLK